MRIGSRGVVSSPVPHHPAYGSVHGGSAQIRPGPWQSNSPHPHLQIRHRRPHVPLGPFRDLAGDGYGCAPPPGEVTTAKKFRAGLAALKEWLKKSRSLPLPELIAILKSKLQGIWNYYGVIGNADKLWKFAWFAQQLIYKWLNRRSQRRSYTWTSFGEAWERWKMPSPRIVEKPWEPARQAAPCPL